MSAMGLKIYAGRAFHLPKSSGSKPHLWIVVTDPDDIPEKVVMVNLTTRRSDSDNTLILENIDHPFIRHETVVYYADARFVEVSQLQNAITSGISKFDHDCSSTLLEKIQMGLLQSPFTPNKIKEYCKELFTDFF